MKNFLLFAALITNAGDLQSQSVSYEYEMQQFTLKYMTAYNEQNLDALKTMYSEYAVRVDPRGDEIVGANEIMKFFRGQFMKENIILYLKPSTIVWSEKENAYVAQGTFEKIGKTIVYDIEIKTKGAYTNVMIKDKDQWKIAKSTLSPLVKVMVHHQVEDFDEWKWAFKKGLPMRLAAGELSEEIGAVDGEPNTVYIISEWASLEEFQVFFSNPDLKKKMKEAGVIGKSTVVILNKE